MGWWRNSVATWSKLMPLLFFQLLLAVAMVVVNGLSIVRSPDWPKVVLVAGFGALAVLWSVMIIGALIERRRTPPSEKAVDK